MTLHKLLALSLACALAAAASHAASPRFDPAAAQHAQREALAPLARFDGRWRGPAWILMPGGTRMDMVQTERVGPFLDGAVRVIEGRGHDARGQVVFNAFGTIAFDPARGRHTLHSHAMGHVGAFPLTVTPDGFRWEMPAGPGTTIRYTARVADGRWTETGERITDGAPPVQIFSMVLERIGDTDWPAAGAVAPR